MFVNINGNDLNVEVLGADDAPVLIAHHGGGGIGSLAEPKATFGPLADSCAWWSSTPAAAACSEGKPPFSHAQWAADVDGLREWLGRRRRSVVAGGSYGGFIAMEYAIAYPDRVRAMILRDTSADNSNLDRAYENARNQNRVEINWDNFDRYWGGQIRDDEDLKARWAEIIPLYDFEYDAEQVGRARRGRHLPLRGAQLVLPAQHARLRPQAAAARGTLPDAGDRGADGLGHAGVLRRDDRVADPGLAAGGLREVRALPAVRGVRPGSRRSLRELRARGIRSPPGLTQRHLRRPPPC